MVNLNEFIKKLVMPSWPTVKEARQMKALNESGKSLEKYYFQCFKKIIKKMHNKSIWILTQTFTVP